MRCGIYVRVSTDDQRDNGYSIESQIVKEIFELCKQGHSTRNIATIMHDNNAYLKQGKWLSERVYKILTKEYTIELVKKLDCIEENDNLIFTNFKNIGFTFLYDLLTRKAKRDLIHRLISQIEISRDKNYNIDIKNIKFTDELITKSNKEYIKYLNKIMENNNIRLHYLKENKKALYTTLLMTNKLTNHLISVSKNSEGKLQMLMENYKNSDEKLSEKNKEINHIEWSKLMNNYKNMAEESILNEFIFI